jgi:1-acyl-sn-glycerol-3-phosphate acyltransferase
MKPAALRIVRQKLIMSAVFSLLYWCYFSITSIVLFLGALVITGLTAPFDPTRRLLHRYTCWWATLYLRCLPGCRIDVQGREKIAPHTAYVLVANHQSMTDIMALSALAVPFKWVSKKEAFRLPFIGWNMYLNRCVGVDRGNMRQVRATMELCRQWLNRGVPLMMFPEGHRSPTGELIDFHNGSFKLAISAGCAVVPIVVNGTAPIYRGWRVLARPGHITVRVLDPIAPAEFGNSAEKLRNHVYQLIKQELAEIRGQPAAPTAV